MKKWLIIFMMILTFIGIMIVYYDYDRTIRLGMTPMNKLINIYSLKQKSKNRRIVAVINCNDNTLCNKTLKSLLDQSIRLHDIAVQTNEPQKINSDILKVISIHSPGTELIREMDRKTIILKIKNGEEYPFDYIENQLEMRQEI